MPYIDKVSRDFYTSVNKFIDEMLYINSKGDLEYLIFKLMRKYMLTRDYNYSNLHDCVYSAQHCSDEFRRRYLDKREDEAMLMNGDIK
jgi:hypothetical protein